MWGQRIQREQVRGRKVKDLLLWSWAMNRAISGPRGQDMNACDEDELSTRSKLWILHEEGLTCHTYPTETVPKCSDGTLA